MKGEGAGTGAEIGRQCLLDPEKGEQEENGVGRVSDYSAPLRKPQQG